MLPEYPCWGDWFYGIFIYSQPFFAGEYPDLLNQAKFGVLLGTIVAGMLGYMVLNAVLPKVKDK